MQNVSDTAFWVASYRAIENEKSNALFHDPLAGLLSGEHGKKVSHSMKSVARYVSWSVIIRTCLIDKYIVKYTNQEIKTIINLGAGLDTRPYRLALPSGIQWIEVDFPDVIALKNAKLNGQQPKCDLERIGTDLSNEEARRNLFNTLNDRVTPALVLTEGVIPYLSESTVASLAKDIQEQSRFKYWITEYFSPDIYPRFQSKKTKKLLGNSSFQFFPEDWCGFFEKNGWILKEMDYLYDEGEKYNRQFPMPWWALVLKRIIGEEKVIKSVRGLSGYIVLEKGKTLL